MKSVLQELREKLHHTVLALVLKFEHLLDC